MIIKKDGKLYELDSGMTANEVTSNHDKTLQQLLGWSDQKVEEFKKSLGLKGGKDELVKKD